VQSIRQATDRDAGSIANLVSDAPFVHRHLDWTPLLDWLKSSPFLLYENDNVAISLLACPQDPVGIAWIKCFACAQHYDPSSIFKSMLEKIINENLTHTDNLFALGLQDWFMNALVQNHFLEFQKVIVLMHERKTNPPPPVTAIVRPMEMSDIEEVGLVDREAFESMWVISSQALKLAYLQSAHASVVELDGKLIGYELSTANGSSAHLARVAVHPDHQNESIASNLVHNMISYFHRHNIFSITVNTQQENHSSQALYRKMGFHLTGERYPIYRLSL
jgi:ribosomal-protein-alanine N-acetyltransferase